MSSELPTSSAPRGSLDEWVAVIVALGVIGTIMALGFGRSGPPAPLSLAPTGTRMGDRLLPPAPPSEAPTPPAMPLAPSSPGRSLEPTRSPQAIQRAMRRQAEQFMASGRFQTPSRAVVSLRATGTPVANRDDLLDFVDVPEDYWAKPFLDQMAEQGLLDPSQPLQPDQPMTRAEYAYLVNKSLPQQERQVAGTFEDVTDGHWARDAIIATAKSGFLSSTDQAIQPDEPLTRLQLFLSLNRGLALDPSPRAPDEILQIYGDRSALPDAAIPAVVAVTDAGLVVANAPETLCLAPDCLATRAEIISMIYQARVWSELADPISSPYIVRP
jgi:hypothetical protein